MSAICERRASSDCLKLALPCNRRRHCEETAPVADAVCVSKPVARVASLHAEVWAVYLAGVAVLLELRPAARSASACLADARRQLHGLLVSLTVECQINEASGMWRKSKPTAELTFCGLSSCCTLAHSLQRPRVSVRCLLQTTACHYCS